MSLVKNIKINDNNTANFTVEVNSNEYLALHSTYEDKLLSTVHIDGFRPGKVPRDIAIKKINTAALEAQVMEQVISLTSAKAYNDLKIVLQKDNRIILTIRYDLTEGKEVAKDDLGNLTYNCIADLLPNIDMSKITSIKVKPVTTIEGYPTIEEYTKEQVKSLMTSMNEYESSDAKSEEGDKVIMSFDGKLNGESKPGLNAEEYTLVLGSNEFLPDFEKSMYGVIKGEEKTFPVLFPSDYFSEEFRGKTVEFNVKVKDVLKAKFTDLKALVESSPERKEQLGEESDVIGFVASRYNLELDEALAKQNSVLFADAVIKESPAIEIEAKTITEQTDRIFAAMKEDADKQGVSMGNVFTQTGLRTERKDILTADALVIRQEIEVNVKEQLKYEYIILAISLSEDIEKPTEQIITQYTDQIEKNPAMYGVEKGKTRDEIESMVVENLTKKAAEKWLKDKVLIA